MLWATRVHLPGIDLPGWSKRMVDLADGSFLLFAEGGTNDSTIVMFAFAADGSVRWHERIRALSSNNWPCRTVNPITRTPSTFLLQVVTNQDELAMLSMDTSGTVLAGYTYGFGACGGDVLSPLDAEEGILVTSTSFGAPGGHTLLMRLDNDLHAPGCWEYPITILQDTLTYSLSSGAELTSFPLTSTDILGGLSVVDKTTITEFPCSPETTGPPNDAQDPVVVAPNPVDDRITVKAGSLERIELLDALGRVVKSSNCHGENEVQVDVRGLMPGLYELRIERQGRWLSRKILKH